MRLAWPGVSDPLALLAVTVRASAFVAGALIVLWFLSDLVLLLFAAVLIAVLLRGFAEEVSTLTRLPVGVSLALVTIGVFLVFAGIGYWVGPNFVKEGKQLASQVSGWLDKLDQETGGSGSSGLVHTLSQHLSNSTSQPSDLLRPGLTVVRGTIGTLGSVLIVVVTAIYLAAAPAMYLDGTVRLVPIGYRPRARQILVQISHTLRWWQVGQAIDMLVVGTLSGVGLALIGVPLALALAVVAGLLTFVPYFGAIAGAVPALIVAATLGFSKMLWVIGVFLVCHGVEGYIVAPIVQRRTVELPPALTLMAMVLLGAAYGVLGLILATPVIAMLLVVVREAYVGDVLGDHEDATTPSDAARSGLGDAARRQGLPVGGVPADWRAGAPRPRG